MLIGLVRIAVKEMPNSLSTPRARTSSFVPPVSSRLREVTTYDTDEHSPSHDPSAHGSEDVQPAGAESDAELR